MTAISPDRPDFTQPLPRLAPRPVAAGTMSVAAFGHGQLVLFPEEVDDAVLVTLDGQTTFAATVGANIAAGVDDPYPRELLSPRGRLPLLVPVQHRGQGITIDVYNGAVATNNVDYRIVSYAGLAADLLAPSAVPLYAYNNAVAAMDVLELDVEPAGLYDRLSVTFTAEQDTILTARWRQLRHDTSASLVVDVFLAQPAPGVPVQVDIPVAAPGLTVRCENQSVATSETTLLVRAYRSNGS